MASRTAHQSNGHAIVRDRSKVERPSLTPSAVCRTRFNPLVAALAYKQASARFVRSPAVERCQALPSWTCSWLSSPHAFERQGQPTDSPNKNRKG